MASTPVKAAAAERASRTLWQGLAIDVLVAVAAALLAWLPEADVLDGAAWLVLGTVLIKTVLQAAAAYVMRLKLAPAREAVYVDGAHVITDIEAITRLEQPGDGPHRH